jgi:hypothetical protein
LRVVGTNFGVNHVYDERHALYSTMFKISGTCGFDVGIVLDL